jgi:hypothetical protein
MFLLGTNSYISEILKRRTRKRKENFNVCDVIENLKKCLIARSSGWKMMKPSTCSPSKPSVCGTLKQRKKEG